MEGLLESGNRENNLYLCTSSTLMYTPQIISPSSLHLFSVAPHVAPFPSPFLPDILFLPWLPLRPLEQCTICFLVLLLHPITPCPIHLYLQPSNLSYFPTLHSSAFFLFFPSFLLSPFTFLLLYFSIFLTSLSSSLSVLLTFHRILCPLLLLVPCLSLNLYLHQSSL
jgi:hypothetical protein